MAGFTALAVFAGLPVRDLASAVEWYGRLFARDPDGRPTPQIAEYYLAVDRVPERGTLQLHEDPHRAGGGLATINVDDIAAIARALEAMDVPFETQEIPIDALTRSAVTVGSFEDPDGNALAIVQPHRRGTAPDYRFE